MGSASVLRSARRLLLALGLARLARTARPPAGCSTPRECGASRDHALLQRARPSLKRAVPLQPDVPETLFVDAVVRDFTAEHPDFPMCGGRVTGLVESRLDADGKPVFRGGSTLTNRSNFDKWYRDTPGVNKELPLKLALTRSDGGTYVHNATKFFPIDGQGWNDSATAADGEPHNFYFTLEIKGVLTYNGGETLRVRTDHDAWVFVDDKLAVDLGGVHKPMEKDLALDSLNLEKGANVNVSLFFAERSSNGSNFMLETNFRLLSPEKGTCVLWGDPHVSTFDRSLAADPEAVPLLNLYDSGDFWLVKSLDLHIQGRYMPTRWTAGGLSALLKLAVGGPALGEHVLVIEPMGKGGRITWDGKPILEDMPSEFSVSGLVNISFDGGDKSDLIDPSQGYLPLRTVTGTLPKSVKLVVNRWPMHIDAIITMPQPPESLEGHCGNFNLDASDDADPTTLKRQIPEKASLLGSSPWTRTGGAHRGGPVHIWAAARSLDDCSPRRRARARKLCEAAEVGKGHAVASKASLEACIFDVCYGGKEFAAEDAVIGRQASSK